MLEVERKFLVGALPRDRYDPALITQGYLHNTEDLTVRVEFVDRTRYGGKLSVNLSVKSPRTGLVREEDEFEITERLGDKLLWSARDQRISKVWSKVAYGGREWEVDDYLDENFGLRVAEIEFDDSKPIELPPWVGREVTGDHRYTNANLALRPYKSWRSR